MNKNSINKDVFLAQCYWPLDKEHGQLTWQNKQFKAILEKNNNLFNLTFKQINLGEELLLLSAQWDLITLKTLKFNFIGADFSNKTLEQQLLLIEAQFKTAQFKKI